MKIVAQRVLHARVDVKGETVAQIKNGLLSLVCIEQGDDLSACTNLMKKLLLLRIFEDDNGKMNLSLLDSKGEHLMVPQFTLAADLSSGNRPSFKGAAAPDIAKTYFESCVQYSTQFGVTTSAGIFGADMKVTLCNDGPATFILQSRE